MPIQIDEENLKSGILGVIVASCEVIQEVLEREALRRMGPAQLSENEINRLANGLMELDAALKHMKTENGIVKLVQSVRFNLDKLVQDNIDVLADSEKYEKQKVR